MAGSMHRPVELDLERSTQLRIRWSDGHESVYPLAVLRRSCPCATCRHGREEQARNPLHVMTATGDQREMGLVEDAALVGHYALRIKWKDGHDTGIFDFQMLRGLCPCGACRT